MKKNISHGSISNGNENTEIDFISSGVNQKTSSAIPVLKMKI